VRSQPSPPLARACLTEERRPPVRLVLEYAPDGPAEPGHWTSRILWPSTRTRRRISIQLSMLVSTVSPRVGGPAMRSEDRHRGPRVASHAMDASRSDRPSVMPPCDARLGCPGDARSKCRSHLAARTAVPRSGRDRATGPSDNGAYVRSREIEPVVTFLCPVSWTSHRRLVPGCRGNKAVRAPDADRGFLPAYCTTPH
jgi:hypothetical protein